MRAAGVDCGDGAGAEERPGAARCERAGKNVKEAEMSRNTGNKSAAPRKNVNPLLTGILVGMVIGVGMAAGLAWYIMKSPSPFVPKEPANAKLPVEIAKPKAPAGTTVPNAPSAAAASGVVD